MSEPAITITRDQVLEAIYAYVRWDDVGSFRDFKAALRTEKLSGLEISCARIYAVAALELVDGSNEFRAKAIGKTSWAHRNHIQKATMWETATAARIISYFRQAESLQTGVRIAS